MRENRPPRSTKRKAAAPAAFLFLAAVAWSSVALVSPPAAVPESAPPEQFSSERAMRHVRNIAERPHPTGTAENARVRDYIISELRALGLEPEVQAAEVVVPSRGAGGMAVAARVENVVARLKGSEGGRALMLSAHYDSVPTAPGATDDASGVATLLETLRALRSVGPLRNDLVFLFTDGEELGLLGARAFAEGHELMKDVALVLNFEGRGAGGPVMMFETSEGNAPLIRGLAAAPRTIAGSLMYAVYERLPNDTDLTVFKRAGAAGLNFAYAERLTHYHTALDTPEEMDERSLQHQGSYALALSRRFGDGDLRELKRGDAVYFNLYGTLFIHYPATWVPPITIALIIVFAAIVAVGLRRRRLSVSGIMWGALALLAAMLSAGLTATLAWRVVRLLHPGFEALPWRTPYDLNAYLLGFIFLTVGLTLGIYALALRRANARDLLAGALVWWVTALVVVSVLLPSGSYLFAWPVAASLAGLAFLVLRARDDEETAVIHSLTALTAAPAFALVSPLVYLFGVMMGLDLAGYLMMPVVLALALAAPVLAGTPASRRWLPPSLAALAGVVFIATALLGAGFDARRKKVNSLYYHLDSNDARAFWVSADRERDEWTSQFIRDSARKTGPEDALTLSRSALWRDDAPALPLSAPALEVVEDKTEGELRTLRVRVRSVREAQMILVGEAAPAVVQRLKVNGRDAWAAPRGGARRGGVRYLSYSAPPAEGFELTVETTPRAELRLVIEDLTFGLPAEIMSLYRPRPVHSMPVPNYRWSDTTVVRRTFEPARAAAQ